MSQRAPDPACQAKSSSAPRRSAVKHPLQAG
jgi:hypothetical protein